MKDYRIKITGHTKQAYMNCNLEVHFITLKVNVAVDEKSVLSLGTFD